MQRRSRQRIHHPSYHACVLTRTRVNDHRTILHSSTIPDEMNGDNVADSDDPYYMANQFQPRTMKVSESLAFFVRFVAHTIMEKRAQNSKGRDNRRRLRDRLKQVAFPRKSMKDFSDETLTTATAVSSSSTTTTPTTTTKNRLGKWHKINESRKSLIRLVIHQ
jgi:hypothetical protein